MRFPGPAMIRKRIAGERRSAKFFLSRLHNRRDRVQLGNIGRRNPTRPRPKPCCLICAVRDQSLHKTQIRILLWSSFGHIRHMCRRGHDSIFTGATDICQRARR